MRLIALLAAVGCLAGSASEVAVRAVLDEQVRAWNKGDLEAFVLTYSKDALFVGKDVTRGSTGVLERYRRNYPDRARMGTLNFTDIEIRMLDGDFASVLGRYHLVRQAAAGGPAHGIFTLLLKRTGGKWLIVLDHTS